jgi:hypothetical protein
MGTKLSRHLIRHQDRIIALMTARRQEHIVGKGNWPKEKR